VPCEGQINNFCKEIFKNYMEYEMPQKAKLELRDIESQTQ
jgi:hypothetical protein